MAYPTVMPGYPLQVYPRAESIAPRTDTTTQNFRDSQGAQATPGPSSIHSAPYTSPMVTPIVALVLPNYLYPVMGPGPPPQQPVYQAQTGVFPTQTLPFAQAAFPFPPSFSGQTQFNVQTNFTPPQAAGSSTPSFCFPPSSEIPKPFVEGQSRSSTPQSGGAEGQASPCLFQSRCSSPLNLLELELNVDRQDGAMLPSGGRGNTAAEREQTASASQPKERELNQVNKEIQLPFVLFFFFPPGSFLICQQPTVLMNFNVVGSLYRLWHVPP